MMKLKLEEMLKLTQEQLLVFNYIELIKRKYRNRDILFTDNYIYAKGRIPILLVAHCDIVHKSPPETIVYDREQKIMWSPTGIGGDDRCGVYAILKICEKYKPYVLFTTDEEIGGVGAKKFVQEINELPVNFIIEIDRRGNNQVVYYRCANKEFQDYIESFGFDKNYGSYSDVSTLSTTYDIAGCNVSAGYYNEHTTTEHIYINHLYNTINKIKRILRDYDNHKFYDCQEEKVVYNYRKYYDCYDYDDYDYDDICKKKDAKEKKVIEEIEEEDLSEYYDWIEMEDDWFDLTDKQWKDKYGKDKPKNILEIYYEGERNVNEV